MSKQSRNIAVIGSGAREHALVWKLNEFMSEDDKIYPIPGNPGTHSCEKTTYVSVDFSDFGKIADKLKSEEVGYAIVGSEVQLAAGIAEVLLERGIKCFGPTSDGAKIESDKKWAKEFMGRHGIPTAEWVSFTDPDEAKKYIQNSDPGTIVLKATGLAGGKGVFVPDGVLEATKNIDDLKALGEAAETIIIEKRLTGEEVSVLAFTDGQRIDVMLPVQDHKRLDNQDKGPNTGGMGAFCPFALKEEEMDFITKEILQRAVTGMAEENIKYVGVLYAGLMITDDGIKVLEFNCRFGDPEAQVLMPLLKTDLFEIVKDCCEQKLGKHPAEWYKDKSCVGVVIASRFYPYLNETIPGPQTAVVTGLSEVEDEQDLYIFYGNTGIDPQGALMARTGRIFTVVARDINLIKASYRATAACGHIKFGGARYRTDIGDKGFPRAVAIQGRTTYQSAGVDIKAGDDFIKKMKADIESTYSKNVRSTIGGYAALYGDERDRAEKNCSYLVTGCDGVGTKLKLAQLCNNHSTVGQDLVAMCVNDILAQGAKPLFFLDYFSCGKLNANIATPVIHGIIKGCKIAKCALVGGETAEMPGFYKDDEYDLAGFVVGEVHKNRMLPKDVSVGDQVIYLRSSGIHSNGFSLVREIFNDYSPKEMAGQAPFSKHDKSYAEELLTPTEIYTDKVLPLIEEGLIKAFAHITGGGLLENIGRVLPPDTKVELDATKWVMPPVFGWIAVRGGVGETEMLRTFNCGVGAVVIVSPDKVDKVLKVLETNVIGEVVGKAANEPQVIVHKFVRALSNVVNPLVTELKKSKYSTYIRVAVFISGAGTNLKALIESTLRDSLFPARIVLVISSSAKAEGIGIAAGYDIPVEMLPAEDINLIDVLKRYNIDLICLAGFMRILRPLVVAQYEGKIMNIHPSLLPAFKGLRAQAQALNAGVKFTGCTVHFVDITVDGGAIIDQRMVPIFPDDTEELLTERIKEQEHELYPLVLKMVASGKIQLNIATKKVERIEQTNL